MDREGLEPASQWLNTISETELANVLYRYGEEPRSRRIAKAIIEGRPWTSTLPLAECIKALPDTKIVVRIRQHVLFKPFRLPLTMRWDSWKVPCPLL